MTKSIDELLDQFQTELFAVEAMVIKVEGHDEELVFSRDMESPHPQALHFILPEYASYTITFHYRALKRDLRNLSYSHVVKRHGIPFKTRKDPMDQVAVVNSGDCPAHQITLSPETLPGGMLIRGKYPALSTFSENDQVLLVCEWTVELVKKGTKPAMGGFE